jgi:MFS family permease
MISLVYKTLRVIVPKPLAIVTFGHSLNHGMDVTYGALLVLIGAEFDVGLSTLGLLATLGAVVYGVIAIPGGLLTDRIGFGKTLILALIGSGISALVVCGSVSIISLAVGLMLVGAFGGVFHPAGLAFVASNVRRRTEGMGVFGAGGNLGVAITPVIVTSIAVAFGWRAGFFVFSGLLIFSGLLMLTVHRSLESSAKETSSQELDHSDSMNSIRGSRGVAVFPTAMIILVNSCLGFLYRGTVTFLPLHFINNSQFSIFGFDSIAIAGFLVTGTLLMGAFGQYIGGILGDRTKKEPLLIVLAILLVPLLLGVGWSTGWILILATAVYAFVYFMAPPSYNALAAEYVAPHLRGRVFGLIFFGAFGIGSLAGIFGGVVAEQFGSGAVFLALAGVSTLVVAAAVSLSIYSRNVKERQ